MGGGSLLLCCFSHNICYIKCNQRVCNYLFSSQIAFFFFFDKQQRLHEGLYFANLNEIKILNFYTRTHTQVAHYLASPLCSCPICARINVSAWTFMSDFMPVGPFNKKREPYIFWRETRIYWGIKNARDVYLLAAEWMIAERKQKM